MSQFVERMLATVTVVALALTTTGTASGTVIVSPSGLSSNGQNFAAWLHHR